MSKETSKAYAHALRFLIINELAWKQVSDVPFIDPDITVMADDSVDLHWRVGYQELLIYIANKGHEDDEMYGDNLQTKIRGRIDVTQTYNWLWTWLMQ